jgi:hypothetical protein
VQSLLEKPLTTLSALMERTTFYFYKNQTLELIPSHLNQKQTIFFIYWQRYCLPEWQFFRLRLPIKSVLWLNHLCVSILCYILGETPRFWRQERKTVLKPGAYIVRDNFPVHLKNKGDTLC